jgi:hypothetical protein
LLGVEVLPNHSRENQMLAGLGVTCLGKANAYA